MASSSSLWVEFAQIVVAHALAVASPGPDFAMVLRQSLRYGRRIGVWTSIGVGCGILVHVTYSLVGVGLMLKGSVAAFTALKFAGAAYLGWIGLQALRSAQPRGSGEAGRTPAPYEPAPGIGGAWRRGFVTNALNIKATLFFLALFPTVVSAQTPKWVQAGYGLWMAGATMAWFAVVACVFTQEAARRTFVRSSHWIDRVLGLVFIGFAVSLVLTTFP